MSYFYPSNQFPNAETAYRSLQLAPRLPKCGKDYRLGLTIAITLSGLSWAAVLAAIL